MVTKIIFTLIVLASCGVIYGVHYQRQQERLFMRRFVIKELKEFREAQRLSKAD